MYKLTLTIKARCKSERLLRDLKRAIHDLTARFAEAGRISNQGLESLAFLGKPELEVQVETPPARVYTAEFSLPGRDWIHYEVERVEDVLAGSAEVVSYTKGRQSPMDWSLEMRNRSLLSIIEHWESQTTTEHVNGVTRFVPPTTPLRDACPAHFDVRGKWDALYLVARRAHAENSFSDYDYDDALDFMKSEPDNYAAISGIMKALLVAQGAG
jgi:hypothetical protein